MDYRNNIIKSNTINQVIKLYEDLINQDYNVIVVLDIDDTVLSSIYGRNFVEKEICLLVDLVYSSNPSNLLFLTARDINLRQYTINKLNHSGLLHKDKYINYNVICSPCDDEGNSTKGVRLKKYIVSELDKNILTNNKKNWIIFVDDLMEHIESVFKYFEDGLLDINYTLVHYRYKK
jgi:hypothetical protein